MYVYKFINLSSEPRVGHPPRSPSFEEAANRWAAMGWRTVSAIPSQGPGYADTILIERWEK